MLTISLQAWCIQLLAYYAQKNNDYPKMAKILVAEILSNCCQYNVEVEETVDINRKLMKLRGVNDRETEPPHYPSQDHCRVGMAGDAMAQHVHTWGRLPP